MMKRSLALLFSGVLLTSWLPLDSVQAATMDLVAEEPVQVISARSGEDEAEQLEKALKAVKKKIAVPEDYTEFNYYFFNENTFGDSTWRFNWRNPTNNHWLQVTCDEEYRITNYQLYNRSEQNNIPVYLKSELKDRADQFIQKIAPQVIESLEFVEGTYQGIYQGSYQYSYQRVENGIPFPEDKISVSVHGTTGEVTAASIAWHYDVKIPSKNAKLTKEEAAEIIGENLAMKLSYRNDFNHYYSEDKAPRKAYLVYEPDVDYISVDAMSGEVYLTRSQWIEGSKNDSVEEESNGKDMDTGGLTKEEINEINERKNLISEEKAIAIVVDNPYLYIEGERNTYATRLNKVVDRSGKEIYVWNITIRDPRPIDMDDTDTYRTYADAQVNASTGQLIRFYSNTKDYYKANQEQWDAVEVPYDREWSRKRLERFLKNEIPTKFSNSTLVNERNDYIIMYDKNEPIYGGYSFSYQRVNEGVIYPYNSIYGAVDGVTGKIYSYSSQWDTNISFESPKDAMSPEEAFDQFIEKEGYHLTYELNSTIYYPSDRDFETVSYDSADVYQVEHEVRLVYRPDIYPSTISPFTGEQLDSRGEVYQKESSYKYLDLPQSEAYRDVLLLSDMNIGFEGDYFYPQQDITKDEMTQLLSGIGYGYELKDVTSKDKNQPITREEMANDFIQLLGYGPIAKLEGIYRTGYPDEASIHKDYRGAVALAKGLKLMEMKENGYFDPKTNVTRLEAVKLLLRFLEVTNER